MNKKDFYEITEGPNFMGGRESVVYKLPKHLERGLGPSVVKLFLPFVDHNNGVKTIRSPDDLEYLAANEFCIGVSLEDLGIAVPRMHDVVNFPSPGKDHVHYNEGRRIPGVIMGELRGMREFRELSKNERPRALDSFANSIVKSIVGGLRPFDSYHLRNAMYDVDGKAHLLDFCQWSEGETLAGDGLKYLQEEHVLPKHVWKPRKLELAV